MRQNIAERRPRVETLEERVCLAGSVGWDGAGRGAASLTYYIGTAPSSLSQAAVNAAIKTALNAWSAVANIKFTQTTVPNQLRSLDITFRPIDGANGTLARAYLPADVNPARIAGDVQFDSSERWEVGNALGRAAIDLVEVAVHEIGHALGLEHSNAAGSVMAATVSATKSFSGLSASDIAAIRSLYAPATAANARAAAAAATRAKAAAVSMAAAGTTATSTGEIPATTGEAPTPVSPAVFPKFRVPRSWRLRQPAMIAT